MVQYKGLAAKAARTLPELLPDPVFSGVYLRASISGPLSQGLYLRASISIPLAGPIAGAFIRSEAYRECGIT